MITYAYTTLVILQLLDAYTTYRILKAGGQELNPALLKLDEFLKQFTNAKWAWLVIAKSVAIVLGYFIAVSSYEYTLEALIACCIFYIGVVGHNMRSMKRGH